ncbi:MAG: cadherin-like domain-containing protein, partial [Pirellulales bacterium]|nr:cadherin-like domain-containing protein [Pirellulales bacterium]
MRGAGLSLIHHLFAPPTHGTLTLNDDGSFDYVADSGYEGSDSFIYSSSDGQANSGLAAVSLYVGYYDFVIDTFTSDGTQLSIGYSVAGDYAPDFTIGLYASPDGVMLGELLQSIPVDTTAGTRSLVLTPEFTDLQQDYFLMAAVDGDEQVAETDETNNALLFAGGAFLAADPFSGGNSLQYQGSAAAEDVLIVPKDATTVRLLIGDPAASARDVPPGAPQAPFYDVTGDEGNVWDENDELVHVPGQVSRVDADAI